MAATDDFIAALDDALARAGQNVTLRRVSGTAPSLTNHDATVRAVVRSFQPEEVVSGIVLTDSKVIISPTDIAAWPGDGAGGNPAPDIPKVTDKLVIAGRVRSVKIVQPFYVDDALVRIELAVAG